MTKKFGFWTLTFLVIANMIGAGVFATSGFALHDLGSPHVVILAWAVGGVIALAGAFSYGRLVRAMPESGGEYLFLSRAAHPMLGFVAGWVSLIAGFSGAIAFAATALGLGIDPVVVGGDFRLLPVSAGSSLQALIPFRSRNSCGICCLHSCGGNNHDYLQPLAIARNSPYLFSWSRGLCSRSRRPQPMSGTCTHR